MGWKPLLLLGGMGLGLCLLGLFAYGLWVEPHQVVIHHVMIDHSRLAKVLRKRVVVHISDLHIGKLGKRERKILKTLEELKPDLVFLTGDYVQWDGDYEAALEFLSRLKAEVGIWAVMGDYDYNRSRKSCLFCHEQGRGKPTRRHRVRFLRNSRERLIFEEGTLWIGGVDRDPLAPIPEGLPLPRDGGRDPIILLSHNPLAFDLIGENQDVLMLSGDTHGGQIPLPTWLWRFLGYEKTARYMQGLFENGRKKMFVSRGIGNSHFPIRLGSSPEVVVLHFSPHQ